MADFLLTEAIDDDDAIGEGNISENMTISDEEFIDDSEINVSRNYTEAIEDSFSDFDFDQEPNNYCNENEIRDLEIDNFKDYKSKIENFVKTLFNPQGLNNVDSFFYAILLAIRYRLSGKVEPCDDEQLKIDIGAEIFDEIYLLKSLMKLNLDILHFENQCL